MKDTYLLSIEIGRECNLAKEHTRCPSADVDRYGDLDVSSPISDGDIIEIITKAYNEMGFVGMIAFHYYNEPMLYVNRMIMIIERIRKSIPKSKFFLNTNGLNLDKHLNILHYFDTIILSNYDKKNWEWIRPYLNPECFFFYCTGAVGLDNRKEMISRKNSLKYNSFPCFRLYTEIIVDYYGNVHLCCMDWKGEVKLGNVVKDGFENVVNKFISIRDKVSTFPFIGDDAPLICKKCILKIPKSRQDKPGNLYNP